MNHYIDGFVFPIPRIHMSEYQKAAQKVADIWKEHGALGYFEFISDDMILEGTKSFTATIEATDDEEVIFGWVIFPSKEVRDLANNQVPEDPRMAEIVGPLVDPKRLIFDTSRMVYGGFRSLVQSNE